MIHVSCHVQKMLSVILITSSFRLRPPLSPPLQSSFKNVMDIDKRKNIIFTTCMHIKLSYKNIHFKSKNKLFTINRLFKYKFLRKVFGRFEGCYTDNTHSNKYKILVSHRYSSATRSTNQMITNIIMVRPCENYFTATHIFMTFLPCKCKVSLQITFLENANVDNCLNQLI